MKQDISIFELLREEEERQTSGLELIASENYVSRQVLDALGSICTNKYAEGYPNARYYGGCEIIDKIEQLAIDRLCQIYGAEYANVQPHSGAQANMAVMMACLKPGETFMGLDLAHGGHLTHGSPVNMSGILYHAVSYGLDEQTGKIDYDAMEAKALETRPKLIIGGASAYSREWNYARMREIADKVGAILMIDMAHTAGIIAAGMLSNPVKYAHIVTSTTHKTLRGPRGGMILCREEYAKAVDKAIFPGMQGGPLEHIIAAKAICFGEALKPEFAEYQKNVLANARTLAECLMAEGFDLVSGGTDNHLMLVDLRPMHITGKEMEKRLDEVYITVNKNAIPNDPEKPFVTSGIRVGTPAVTSRGLGRDEMKALARLIALTATDFENSADRIRAAVTEICSAHPIYS